MGDPGVAVGPLEEVPAPQADLVEFDFTLMTLNVEEYLHGFDGGYLGQIGHAVREKTCSEDGVKKWLAAVREHSLAKAAQLRAVVEAELPDVLCIQEHSLGVDADLLASYGLGHILEHVASYDGEELLAALLPEGYEHFARATGERPAKIAELANVVAWRPERFSPLAQVGESITPKGKATSNGRQHYTPRSAACVELQPVGASASFVACSTHLMGGRYEDEIWAADNEAGLNERVNQVVAVVKLFSSSAFSTGVPAVIAGDFNVMNLGFSRGPFVRGCQKYVIGDTKLYPRERLEKDYHEIFVPYQTAVHATLEDLGFAAAYGRGDDVAEMKTSRFGGCTDWIYCRGLATRKDERVLDTGMLEKSGGTDHSAVAVTLSLSWQAEAPAATATPVCGLMPWCVR